MHNFVPCARHIPNLRTEIDKGDGVALGYRIRSSDAVLGGGSGVIEGRLKRCLSPVGDLLGAVEVFGRGLSLTPGHGLQADSILITDCWIQYLCALFRIMSWQMFPLLSDSNMQHFPPTVYSGRLKPARSESHPYICIHTHTHALTRMNTPAHTHTHTHTLTLTNLQSLTFRSLNHGACVCV